MIRRPFCGMAAGFLLGIWCEANEQRQFFYLAAALLLTGGCLYFFGIGAEKNRRIACRVFLILCMLLLGGQRYRTEYAAETSRLAGLTDGMTLRIQGKLSSKEYKNDQYIYYLTACLIGKHQEATHGIRPVECCRIMVCFDSDSYTIGETLLLDGTIRLWKPAVNAGGFDEKAYYRSKKIAFQIENAVVKAADGNAAVYRERLYQLKMRLAAVYEAAMGTPDSGIMMTALLGDRSLLDREVRALYQDAGILHTLSISGLHISVIGMSLYRLLRKRKAGFFAAGCIAGMFVISYGQMVGMGISVKRAAGMLLLSMLAQAFGRAYDSLNALGILALLLLWENPFLFSYAGFLFSFAAVIGVVGIKTFGKKEGLPEKLFHGFAIQLTTLPFVAWYYYEAPLYAILINLFLLPFFTPLLLFGLAGGAAGLLQGDAAEVLLVPCHLILTGYQKVCGFCNMLPGAVQIVGRPASLRIACYFLLLFVWNFWRIRRRKKREHSKTKKECMRRRYSDFRRDMFCGLLLMAFLFFPSAKGFELDVLDVGQGDAEFVRTKQGYTVFIDGGSSDAGKVGEYRILPFLKINGARKIDYWFVSHADKDHISGLSEVLEQGYPVCHLVFFRDILQDEAFLELKETAQAAGTDIFYMKKGDVLHLGEASVRVIAPAYASGERNKDSLVIWYEEDGFSALFTGDIGIEEEKKILEEMRLEHVDFYKAGHHGSNYSNSAEFLEALNPAVSAVSCSRGNSYGHPGAEAVAHMEAVGSRVFYTMEAGQIRVTREGDEFLVRQYQRKLDVFRFPVLYF